MHFAVYIRVSTEDQVHGYSLSEQKESCKKRALELGAIEDNISIYADEGVSGSLIERPGLTALREAIKESKIDYLIVRDPDRLSRKLSHQLLLTEEFEKNDLKLEFLNFDWKDTPEGRLFYSVRGAIAEYEKEKIRERTTLGKIQKAKEGGIPVRFDTYGYTYDVERQEISIKEEEAEVVEKIFSMYIEKDLGCNGIAKFLNEMDIPTRRRKGKWHRQVVMQILTNTSYMGIWYYRKRKKRGGKIEQRDPKDWIAVEVPAIIDQAVFIRAQEKIEESRRLWNKKGFHSYLLSGMISCSDCGNTMTGVYAKWWGQEERRYTCAKSTQGAKNFGCRPRKVVIASIIEDVVWGQVKSWLFEPDIITEEVVKCELNTEKLNKEIGKITKQITETEKGRDNLLLALSEGLTELDEKTQEILANLKQRIKRLEVRKKELEDEINDLSNPQYRVEEVKKITVEVLKSLDKLSFEEKRELIRLLVKQVMVMGRQTYGNKWGNIEVTILAKLMQEP